MNNYNNVNFDGCVLEIDSFMIKTNPEIKEALNELLEAYKVSNSQFLPSRIKNMYELKNWERKSESIKQRKKQQDLEKKAIYKREQERIKGDFIPIGKRSFTFVSYNECKVFIKEEVIEFSTKKGSLKMEVKNKFNLFLKNSTLSEFKEFIKINSIYIGDDISFKFYKNSKLILNRHGNLCIKIDLEVLNVYVKGKRNSEQIYQQQTILYLSEEIGYYIQMGFDFLDYKEQFLKGRTFWCSKLIKYKREGNNFKKI